MSVANRLTEAQRAAAVILGMRAFSPGNGFGLGVATVIDPATAGWLRGRGGLGTVGWPGAYGGWWQADPTDGSVMIFLVQNHIEPALIDKGIGFGAVSALMEFCGLANAQITAKTA